MMKLRFLFVFLFLSLLNHPSLLYSAENSPANDTKQKKSPYDVPIETIFSNSESKVETQGDTVEYDKNTKKLIAKNNVVITYQNTQITSDYAEIETESKKSFARGHVTIFRSGKAIAHGEEIHYDFNRQSGNFPDGRLYNIPWFSRGEDIAQVKEGVKIVHKGGSTTCDLKNPHYEIRAKKVTVYDGDKMVAWNVKIYALGKPIFWLPVLVMPLQDNNIPFAIMGGYTSQHGYFAGIFKGFSITKNIWGKLRADWRSKRGFGAGGDFSYDLAKTLGYGTLNMYIADDHNAPTPALSNPFDEREDNLRGRITWKHRKDFDPYSYGLLRYNRLADEFFLQDFFEKEFRSDIEPNSFISLVKNSERYGLLAYAERHMNHFERNIERLPQLQADWRMQPLLNPHLFYQSQMSYNNLGKHIERTGLHPQVNRFDNFHEWSAPLKWKDIKFTPRINGRGTYYSRQQNSQNDRFRLYGELGADLRTQFYRTYNVHSEKLGIQINQIRHIVEPNIQYSSSVSSLSDEKLEHYDTVDRLDDSQFVTFGVENRIQTKRVVNGKMQRVDLVSLNTFISYEMYPDGRTHTGLFGPRENQFTQSDFSVIGQEVTLRPYDWLQYEMRFDYDTRDHQFHMFNHDVVLRAGKFRTTIGHRYASDIPEYRNSNQFVFDVNYQWNKLWDTGGYIRWDTLNDDVSEWQLSARRDLHDFILTIGYNNRNSGISSSNRTLFIEFYLKAFPEIGVHANGSRASFGAPRIGDTVAGTAHTSEPTVPTVSRQNYH